MREAHYIVAAFVASIVAAVSWPNRDDAGGVFIVNFILSVCLIRAAFYARECMAATEAEP